MSKRTNLTLAAAAKVPSAKTATLAIDSETYRLALDFNALADAEPVTECNLLGAIRAMGTGGGVSARQLRGLLYAFLRPLQPAITFAESSSIIRLDTMGRILTAIGNAITLSLAATDKRPEGESANAPVVPLQRPA